MTKKSLLNSLKIQKRVVYALLMREIITRYGRNNIGFLWLILEPMIFTLLFTVMWTIRDMDHVSKLPITIFVLTGYGTMLLWRNTIGRSLSAISSNIGLMYHKNVKPMDIFIARAILEILGTIAAFILIYIIFLWFGLVDQPKDIFKIIGGFFFLVWFAFFGSILIGSLSNLSDIVQKIWSPFSLILMLISGTFFMVEWLPSIAQQYVLWVPIVHCIELIREGFIGEYINAHYSYTYIFIFNLLLTFFSILFLRISGNRIES